MNVHHVVLVVLCCVCVCVCDSNNTVNVVATSLTSDPADCDLSKCPNSTSCTRAFFSDQTSLCFLLHCESNESCERYISDLGNKTQTEEPSQNTGADPLQLPSPSPKSPVSPSLTAPPTALPASAIPSPRPVPLPGPEAQQRSVFSSNTSHSGFSSNINRSSQDGDQGQVRNNSSQNEHQGQPPVSPSTPAPTSPPVPVESAKGGNFSVIFPKVQKGNEVNKTGQETTTVTTSTTSVKPALHTNTTTTTTTTVTTSTTTTSTTTTNKVTPPPSTTQTQPTSTPTPPPSPAPPFLPSVTPSTPAPGHNHSTTASKVLHVTSNQDKAIAETPGGELRRSMLSTSSLIAVLIFGLLFFFVTVVLFLRHAYESYKRRGYTQMDYLINGMYSDSGL
ncbi:uncharacterized protein wu:fa25f02 [Neoarius graeffei]|uniref:uncharacterized protein wu:fa25f02 n=1 Tax=Neoarius graeffei TaxID=443677 RepID=UPI00298BFA33|nr:uncharacterized protein wu:fa25f02 [Neoarius graeffei]XP_060784520.1 uncharacterized protein wu:fa25f02 [Neoarius graeffei]